MVPSCALFLIFSRGHYCSVLRKWCSFIKTYFIFQRALLLANRLPLYLWFIRSSPLVLTLRQDNALVTHEFIIKTNEGGEFMSCRGFEPESQKLRPTNWHHLFLLKGRNCGWRTFTVLFMKQIMNICKTEINALHSQNIKHALKE